MTRSEITERTLIPISLLLVIIGGVSWLTTLYAKTAENTQSITEIKVNQGDSQKTLIDMAERLARIEGKLDRTIRVSENRR